MTNPLSRVHPIAMGETLYQLTNHALCFQFCDTFATHFSPHQFKIATKGDCEVVDHGIMCTLDLYLDWVVFQPNMVNTFNSMLRRFIFQKLHAIGGNIMQLIPFDHAFNAFESPIFYNHYNYGGNITVIPVAVGTYQGDPLGGALFALAHFRALHFITNHPFFSISTHYK